MTTTETPHGYKRVRVWGGCTTWGGVGGTGAYSSEVAPEDRPRLGSDLVTIEQAISEARTKVELVARLETLGKVVFTAAKRDMLRLCLANAMIEAWWPARCIDCGRVLPEVGVEARATRVQGCQRDGWAAVAEVRS